MTSTGSPRSEEEIWEDAIELKLGRVLKRVPPLPANPNRDWKRLLTDKARERFGGQDFSEMGWGELLGVIAGLTDLQVELIVAYDREGHLGGAEWILANASEREIYDAFKRLVVEAHPFLEDAARFPALVAELLPQLLASFGSSATPSSDAPAASSRTSTPTSRSGRSSRRPATGSDERADSSATG